MKKVDKTLIVEVVNNIVCGEGSFKAQVHHNLTAYTDDKGEVVVCVEYMDINYIKFMGLPINGYTEYSNFKAKMLEMGIDIDKMEEEAVEKLDFTEVIKETKLDYYKILGLCPNL